MTPARSSAVLPASQIECETGFLGEVREFFRQFIVAAFDPYRPEQHYMRGPGPACRARRDSASQSPVADVMRIASQGVSVALRS